MKSLQQNNLIKAPFDISWLLEKDILRISKILTSRGANLYAVGGSVRASYWKEEFDNIDFAINITPHEVKELLKNIRCTIIQTGIEYGTLSVLINKKLFEITSFRKDIETFGRKAIVKYTNCIKQDAKRRDFTFNAIYLNMKGEIVDPLGNFSDLAKGKVKFVGDPKKRILEDHLRILRFFRFLSKYPLQNKRVNFRTLKTINEIKEVFKNHSIVLDPHTAIGYGVAKKLKQDNSCIILSTAHPSKFPEAIKNALGKNEELPPELRNVLKEKEKFEILENCLDQVKNYILKKIDENKN